MDAPFLRSATGTPTQPDFRDDLHGDAPIDPASPLANATASSLATEAVEIVVTVTGLDETISQAVHARTSYLAHEVLWGHRFADVFTQTKDGRLAIDYRRFHDTEPLQPPAPDPP